MEIPDNMPMTAKLFEVAWAAFRSFLVAQGMLMRSDYSSELREAFRAVWTTDLPPYTSAWYPAVAGDLSYCAHEGMNGRWVEIRGPDPAEGRRLTHEANVLIQNLIDATQAI